MAVTRDPGYGRPGGAGDTAPRLAKGGTGEPALSLTEAEQEAAVALLAHHLTAARQTIAGSARYRRGGDPTYGVPWFLVLGAETRSLLAAAAVGSPFPPPPRPADDAAVWWSWWLLEPLVAIEAAPALLADPGDRPAWTLFEQALGLLARHRPRQPFDGLVFTVTAEALITQPSEMAALGRRMRAVVDETYQTLRLRCPVFIVVTRCDIVPGHNGFFRHLPTDIAGQAIGHRIEVDRTRLDWCEDIDPFYAALTEKLQRLRLGLFRRDLPALDQPQVFVFPEEFPATRPGLLALCRALTEPNRFDHRPLFRGFWFTAAGSPAPHIADLFKRFLPADAVLARRA